MNLRYISWNKLRSLACGYACMVSVMEFGTESNADLSMELDTEKRFRCAQGFSALQINILGIIKGHPEVLTYWLIAQLVAKQYAENTTEGAVRGALERLFSRGLLLRTRASQGRLKGNRFVLVHDLCVNIQPCNITRKCATENAMEHATQFSKISHHSILEEEEKDRKNLSISTQEAEMKRKLEDLSEEDIAFHWPVLNRDGFGTAQIRQICHRLHKAGLAVDNVLPSLTYAEWDMATGNRKDAQGNPIARPSHWVFQTLARQGYYPRPDGYVSPQEQAERDATEEQRRLAEAQEARFKASCETWAAQLLPQERRHILGDSAPGGYKSSIFHEGVVLRNHFRKEIWPSLKSEAKK